MRARLERVMNGRAFELVGQAPKGDDGGQRRFRVIRRWNVDPSAIVARHAVNVS